MFRRAMLATSLLAATAAPAMAQVVVETFTGSSTYVFTQPGTPMGPGVDYATAETFTTLSFTPGAVTFQGQPVDFSGTEASFLATGYSGSMHIPVLSGPATVNGTGGGNYSGPALNSGGARDLNSLDLGPAFSSSNLDLQTTFTYDSIDRIVTSWNSAAVPELNGLSVDIVRDCTVTGIDPVNGIVTVNFSGQIVAYGPGAIPALSAWGLAIVAAGLLAAGTFLIRRAS